VPELRAIRVDRVPLAPARVGLTALTVPISDPVRTTPLFRARPGSPRPSRLTLFADDCSYTHGSLDLAVACRLSGDITLVPSAP